MRELGGNRRFDLSQVPADCDGYIPARPQCFSLSLGDILDKEVDPAVRGRALVAMAKADHVEFLLLTKRIGLHGTLIGRAIDTLPDEADREILLRYLNDPFPHIAWGTSVGHPIRNGEIAKLMDTPAARRFLSCEPLVGPVMIPDMQGKIDLVVVGGESGMKNEWNKTRPSHPHWIEAIADECRRQGVPCNFKQWGNWGPGMPADYSPTDPNTKQRTRYVRNGMAECLMFWYESKEGQPPLLDGLLQHPRLEFHLPPPQR